MDWVFNWVEAEVEVEVEAERVRNFQLLQELEASGSKS